MHEAFNAEENPLSGQIIGAAIEVHRHLGPGLLESVYDECLARELISCGLVIERQRMVPLSYKGFELDVYFRADLIVQNSVLVEIKSVEQLAPVHTSQIRTYLRLTGLPLGLILNFNSKAMRDGLKRVVL